MGIMDLIVCKLIMNECVEEVSLDAEANSLVSNGGDTAEGAIDGG